MAPRLVNGRRSRKSARAQEDRSPLVIRASTDAQSRASTNLSQGTRRPRRTSPTPSDEFDFNAPIEPTAGTAKRQRVSTSSLANDSATSASIDDEDSDQSHPVKMSKRPARPEIRAKPANKKRWVPPPHTGRSRVAFLDSGMLVMTPTPGQYKEPKWSEDQKALLKRLKKKSKKMHDEEVHKPYANLQHDGKFGFGVRKL